MKNKKIIIYLICLICILMSICITLLECVFRDDFLNHDNIEYTSTGEEKASLNYTYKNNLNITSKKFTALNLNYSVNKNKNSFYVIKCTINMEEVIFENDNENAIFIYVDTKTDYNGKEVVKSITYADYLDNCAKKITLNRVIKSDETGKFEFGIAIGNEKNKFSGNLQICSVEIIPIEQADEYTLICSNDDTVRMVFCTNHINNTETSQKDILDWINIYSKLRKDIKIFTGGIEPYSGTTDFILTEQFDFFGLSGDPIYINSSFVEQKLNSINVNGKHEEYNLIWEYLHEMSHTFDGIGESNIGGYWNFDAEFFATLKTAYALSINDFGMTNDGNAGINIIKHFSKYDTLKNGVYSSNGFIYTLLNTLWKYDSKAWLHLNSVLCNMNKINTKPTNNNDKFKLFWDMLNQEYGIQIELLLTDKEWVAIKNKYSY